MGMVFRTKQLMFQARSTYECTFPKKSSTVPFFRDIDQLESKLNQLGSLESLEESSGSKPIFVFSSCWRSGSTLLQRMLIASTDQLIWGEPYGDAAIYDGLLEPFRRFSDKWPPPQRLANTDIRPDPKQDWIANYYPPKRSILSAHRAFINEMFAEPAKKMGYAGWGIKEVRLCSAHAAYFQWLYPGAKIIFLIRDPYAAYRSHRRSPNVYHRWPDQPVSTPGAFGEHWRGLTEDFLTNAARVNGFILRYEALLKDDSELTRLSEYLGISMLPVSDFELIRASKPVKDASRPSRMETLALKRAVNPIASQMEYFP